MPWYDEKVQQMREMGFEDESASRIALSQTGGNIGAAIEKLVAAPPAENRLSQQPSGGAKEEDADSTSKALAPIFSLRQAPTPTSSQPSQKLRNALSAKKGGQKAPALSAMRSGIGMPKGLVKTEHGSSQLRFDSFNPRATQELHDSAAQPSRPDAHAQNAPNDEETIVLPDDESPEKRKLEPAPPPAAKKRKTAPGAPLAERMRPSVWSGFVGQERVSDMVRGFSEQSRVPSMILWGPPGCGKTTLGRMLARTQGYVFVSLSAVSAGVAEVKKVVQEAQAARSLRNIRTLLFLDEIHRFNKVQQDGLLAHVESGLLTLVGATTENPSFSLSKALLSRAKVHVLAKLPREALLALLHRALADQEQGPAAAVEEHSAAAEARGERWWGGRELRLEVESEAVEAVAAYADGDARLALNTLEAASIRGSDAQAAVYWLARMLVGGEKPEYIARRMIRIASEDVGLGDSGALALAVATHHACQAVGMPECNLALTQCAIQLAGAPKCTAVYRGWKAAEEAVRSQPLYPVPLHLRNANSKVLAELGWGEGYKYNPDFADGAPEQTYLPPELQGHTLVPLSALRDASPPL